MWRLAGEVGVLAAGARRREFPAPTERLLLNVAANQAMVGLQDAGRLSEQKRIAGELDRRVAQRTAELAAANEELRREIAERKLAEESLNKARSELAHVTRVLSLGVLTASIAHEVNQPLATIVTNGETSLRWLTRDEPDIEKARALTKRVVADARRASEIIERIRNMVSHRASEQKLLSIADVIHESLGFLRDEFQSRGISFSLDLASGLPQIVGDRTQLQQVVVNLAVNAAQAMTQSERTRRSILVQTTLSDPETVCCSIEDSGPGIDPEHLPRLFDTFFTTKDTGMGMGLAICRSIVEAHGGRIGADNSSALGGARFSFTLPSHTASKG
jgi:C4-dicarboxylate-specific signal transduction histidine kinase